MATVKRQAEIAAAAKKAAEEARKAKAAGKNPADTPDNDKVKDGLPWWKESAQWLATATNWASIITGFFSAGFGVLGLGVGMAFPPAGAALELLAGHLGAASLAFTGLNVLFTGIGHGWTSGDFKSSLASAALSVITFGQSKWIGALSKVDKNVFAPVATKITQIGHDLVSPITGLLGSLGF
ncbi:hypothetical protein [Streptomyces kronopolitis]